ncbi:MobF family relaxase [Streptomyces sp. BI20]|uniref:MobF family relaxase n=1 Tax=Streptomyces sp. BI20 TaxID=3403460 RepID=UPI003C795C4F
MGWVTVIGPSDSQVDYRLTGGHGCTTTAELDARPLIEAVEAAAEAAGTTVSALIQNPDARRAYFRARTHARGGETATFADAAAVEISLAAGLDPTRIYPKTKLRATLPDRQIDYHVDASERPLVWIGKGLTEHGITPGSPLTPDQHLAARRLMRGEDPNSGRVLVEPKLAVAPAAKLPAAPLLQAIRRTAVERGIAPAALFDSKRKRDAYGRMDRQVHRRGETHRVPASTAFKLAQAAGVDAGALYGEDRLAQALTIENGGHLSGRALVRVLEQRARDTGRHPTENVKKSAARRLTQLAAETSRRRVDLPVPVRDAVALAVAAGLTPEEVWDPEEIKAAQREGRVEVGNRGADVTLDLPKSQSVLLAYASVEAAAEVEAIYTGAGHEAVAALEKWTAYAMRGHHGDGEEAEVIETSGFAGWLMIHRAARPVEGARVGDPHFHLHFNIANMVKGVDGKWSTTASGGRDLHRHARATQALMSARIRRDLTDRYGVAFTRDPNTAAWEISAIPEATRRLFSKRDGQVRQLFEALGIDYDTASHQQRAALSARSKEAKNPDTAGISDDALRAHWQAEGRAAGDDPTALAAAALTPGGPGQNPDVAELCRTIFDPKTGLTSHSKEFSHAAALAAVLDALPYGIGTADEAEQLTTAVLKHAGFAVKLNPRGPQHYKHADRYTTADVVAAETTIMTEATRRLGEQAAVVPADVVTFTLSAAEVQQGFAFSDEQRAVLHRLLTGGHGVDALLGIAGAGKTTIMSAARQAWEAQGYVVAGASTAAIAAANLQAEAGVASRTVASWLTGIRAGGKGLTGVDILIVDEAAMCDDRDVAELLAHAARTGTKIVGVGDPKQLHSPGIGGSFAAVHHTVGGLSLTENFRQKDPVERQALALWRKENRTGALRTLAATGRVHAGADHHEVLAAMLTQWAERREAHTDDHTAVRQLLMLASTNAVVDELNAGARATRKTTGALSGPEHLYALPDGGELALIVGDQVLIRRNDYRSRVGSGHADVLNGTRGIVRAIDSDRRALVEWQTATPDGSTLTAEWLTPEYISEGGLSHGYAITGHKSQGLTVQDVLVYGPGAQSNALYTMLSRQKGEVHLHLPLDCYETDADRARGGVPATDQERVDRAVSGLLREIEAGQDEALVLTELPAHRVPEHLRGIVAALPERPTRTPEFDEDEPGPEGPTPLPDSTRYTHLTDTEVQTALRHAITAQQAADRAAAEAAQAAERAEVEAATGTGPAVRALAEEAALADERAQAVADYRKTAEALSQTEDRHRAASDRLTNIDTALAETGGLFGRSTLRGQARTEAQADRATLTTEAEALTARIAALQRRKTELLATTGPEHEHPEVLATAAEHREHADERTAAARQQDVGRAGALRSEADDAAVHATQAGRRVVDLKADADRRPSSPAYGDPGPSSRGASAPPDRSVAVPDDSWDVTVPQDPAPPSL